MPIKPWQTTHSERLVESPWLTVRREKARLPSGATVDDYYICDLPDAALVMPITPAGEVICVRQYKHGAGGIFTEFPGGRVDPGEPPRVAAERELREETGYAAGTLVALPPIYGSPTRMPSRNYYFIGLQAEPVHAPHPDPHEEVEIVKIPLDQLRDRIASGELCTAEVVIHAYLALDHLGLLQPPPTERTDKRG